MSLEALLTAPQARKIACRYQKQAVTELTSPDGRLRRRTSRVALLPLFQDSPPAHEARRTRENRILCGTVSLKSLLISVLADH